MRFEAKRALVTGGSRGIGRCIAERLVDEGARVHVFDRAAGKLPGAVHVDVDVGDPASVARAVASLQGEVDLLVNNAGITRDRTLMKMSDDEWRIVVQTNLDGAFYMLRAVAPLMAARGRGRVVNVSSINALRGKFGQANYTAAKAGMIALSKTAARELGPRGITVNVVAPGMVLTEMARSLPEEILERSRAETALGTLASPEDVAAAVLFLLSDDAAAITGQVLQVDAGQYI